MRTVDAQAFGVRVRERREELGLSQGQLGEASGYSQQRIGSFEQGKVKRPNRCAPALAEALCTTAEWLLWSEGPRTVGPQYLTTDELVEKYRAMTPTAKEFISRAVADQAPRRRKSG